jgi:hypothetical protein
LSRATGETENKTASMANWNMALAETVVVEPGVTRGAKFRTGG